ncbi:hypothetical protein U9M48_005062 [Paspalum notatum var. saurae]|uniref:Uncharacterized protein n=1 Tax=Paspalum notatum var. saurae TaxID=547442 RepID=A0AAQ3PPC3_PASNO
MTAWPRAIVLQGFYAMTSLGTQQGENVGINLGPNSFDRENRATPLVSILVRVIVGAHLRPFSYWSGPRTPKPYK